MDECGTVMLFREQYVLMKSVKFLTVPLGPAVRYAPARTGPHCDARCSGRAPEPGPAAAGPRLLPRPVATHCGIITVKSKGLPFDYPPQVLALFQDRHLWFSPSTAVSCVYISVRRPGADSAIEQMRGGGRQSRDRRGPVTGRHEASAPARLALPPSTDGRRTPPISSQLIIAASVRGPRSLSLRRRRGPLLLPRRAPRKAASGPAPGLSESCLPTGAGLERA
ncbi:hypothetical protein SKAU_G00058100 [Synaphobranchus kaupii]|uniref:Uncharacterized protein n=1 Tax=Synaphobranchus kaupii TaxID=118154 RepID=A0A9Q1G5S5_SYNKA|nr:hypothetical protein SKAU_G00058100 [Synaphobranchus kaupii]